MRRTVGCHMIGDYLSGGAHVTIDAVGNSNSIETCLQVTKPRGTVILMGMPAEVTVDLTGLWHRETRMAGSYTYGTESMPDGTTARTFDLAIQMAADLDMGRLVSATYPIDDYEDAIAHAASAGRRGAVKVAFDLRQPVPAARALTRVPRHTEPRTRRNTDATSRIRSRGRPQHATHPVLARRELQPRAAARRSEPGHLRARATRSA